MSVFTKSGFTRMRRMMILKWYRTPSFNFPPSRRRDTFEITKSGEIISYSIGAYEAYQKKIDRFKIIDGDKLYVFSDKTNPITMRILSCEDDLLIIQKYHSKMEHTR